MKKTCAVILAFVLLFAMGTMWGQGTSSRIIGVVSDPTGAVVAGASVTATNQATGTTFTTTTGPSGAYVFDGLQIGNYTVAVETKGFKKFVSKDNVLSVGIPTQVNAPLQVGASGETVEVTGGYSLVQTETSGNFGTVVDDHILTQLPIVATRGRNPLDLVRIVPGVVETGVNATGGGMHVQGSRDRAWNYTLDGIDSNETSAGGSQLSPTRVNPDTLAEFRVITGNATAEFGRNSGAQVAMVTKSGGNAFHGNGFWFYQSPFLNANDAPNKASQIRQSKLNKPPQSVQNIYGGTFGGPIVKNKTFFFANVQLLHSLQSRLVTRTVFTQTAKAGAFRYVNGGKNGAFGSTTPSVDANGNVLAGLNISTYNIVASDPKGIGLDTAVQTGLGLEPLPNNFAVGDGLNTAGFTFTAPNIEKQVDLTFRVDHTFNERHSIFVRWASGHQNTYGDDANGGLQSFPGLANVVDTYRRPRNLAASWRWVPTSRSTNELVVGMNRFGFEFINPDPDQLTRPPFNYNLVAQPLSSYFNNSRFLTTYQLVDNYTHAMNAHTFRGGINLRLARHIDHRGSIGSLNVYPQVTFDTGTNPVNFTATPTTQNDFLPAAGIDTSADRGRLASAINDLLGRIGQIQQGYVALDDTTFKPARSVNIMDHRWNEYDAFFQDSWKWKPNLTVDFGLRWEARMAPDFRSYPGLVPDHDVTFSGAAAGNITFVPGDFYKNDWNNFGPSFGFAWDPFKDGKTSIRANYRLAYDRINTFSFSSSVFQGMPGLTYQIIDSASGQGGMRAKNWVIPAPTATPTALRALPTYSLNSLTVSDPNLRTPKVNMWGLSISREIAKNTVFTFSYAGRHGVGLYGGYDANQVDYRSNGFLDEFKKVQASTTYQSPLFDQIFATDTRRNTGETGTAMARRVFTSSISQGNVAGLALAISQRLQTNVPLLVSSGMPATFFQKFPQMLGGMFVLTTNDYSIYHGVTAQVERRFSNGLLFQGAWTWSKSTDVRSFDPTFTRVATGSSQSASATPFDINNPHLNYAPSDFDRTHVFQGSWVFELPFGRGKMFGKDMNLILDHFLGGWEIAGNAIYETGRPITFYAGTNTFSSVVQTPASCVGNCPSDLGKVYFDVLKGQQYFVNMGAFSSTTNCTVSTDKATSFCIPAAGDFSNRGRNYWRQPIYAIANVTLAKRFTVREGQNLQLRLEVQNLTNSQMFDTFGSQSIQSSLFGRVNQENDGVMGSRSARKMQLSMKYSF